MPELPEVQTVVNDLIKEQIVGRKIIKATIDWPRTIADLSPDAFCKQITGLMIYQIERRGKYICAKIGNKVLLIHLRMSGRILVDKNTEFLAHERVRFYLDDGRIIKFVDPRKFGRIYLLQDASERLSQLGADPLLAEFTINYLRKALKRKKKIKTLLLDQSAIAGIGNIYADESLWEAKIHPEKMACELTPSEIKSLHQAIVHVLQKAIANGGTSLGESPSNFHSATGARGFHARELSVYQKTGTCCPRCRTLIERIVMNGRSTHFCPNCQRKALSKA